MLRVDSVSKVVLDLLGFIQYLNVNNLLIIFLVEKLDFQIIFFIKKIVYLNVKKMRKRWKKKSEENINITVTNL